LGTNEEEAETGEEEETEEAEEAEEAVVKAEEEAIVLFSIFGELLLALELLLAVAESEAELERGRCLTNGVSTRRKRQVEAWKTTIRLSKLSNTKRASEARSRAREEQVWRGATSEKSSQQPKNLERKKRTTTAQK
jgi:hypothetical protein